MGWCLQPHSALLRLFSAHGACALDPPDDTHTTCIIIIININNSIIVRHGCGCPFCFPLL